MELDQVITLLILAAAIMFFISEWLRVDLVALSVVVALLLTGILTTGEAVAGFSNSAVITIAALFVVGGGVMQTGLAAMIGRRVLAIAGSGQIRLTLVLMLAVAMLSSFLSDTGTVAVLLPAVLVLSRSAKIPPGKLLIPLSYGSLLGGALTLIGTTPNLITAELLAKAGYTPFRFFSFTPVGLLVLVAGMVFILLIGRNFLPDRQRNYREMEIEDPTELIERYRLKENIFNLRVRQNSPLIGKPLQQTNLGHDYQIICIQINRQETPGMLSQLIPSRQESSGHWHSIVPMKDTVFEVHDILVLEGTPSKINHAAVEHKLSILPAAPEQGEEIINQEIGIAEVLIRPRSNLLGKTILEQGLGSRCHVNVIGILAADGSRKNDIRKRTLQAGDTLLVQGLWSDIISMRENSRDFVLLGQPEAIQAAPASKRASVALLILAGMLAIMIGGWLPVADASLLAALSMVLSGCLSMDEAYQSVDWKSVVLIASMLPMSTALDKVGLVGLAADILTAQLGSFGPVAVLAGLFLFTTVMTQVLSNTATTVLVAPIALTAAQSMGLEPYAFMMAVALAASMAFATPVASPPNTLVMGAGGYRFIDYMKIGIPMIIIAGVVAMFALPVFFPF
jgi:di/tricarboxylate transporter